MHLNHPLILTFAMVFEAVNLPLTLLLWIQHLSVANLDEFVHQSFVHQSGSFLNKFSSSFSKRHQKEILSSKTLFFVNGRMFLKMAIFIHSPYIYRNGIVRLSFLVTEFWLYASMFSTSWASLGSARVFFLVWHVIRCWSRPQFVGKFWSQWPHICELSVSCIFCCIWNYLNS